MIAPLKPPFSNLIESQRGASNPWAAVQKSNKNLNERLEDLTRLQLLLRTKKPRKNSSNVVGKVDLKLFRLKNKCTKKKTGLSTRRQGKKKEKKKI